MTAFAVTLSSGEQSMDQSSDDFGRGQSLDETEICLEIDQKNTVQASPSFLINRGTSGEGFACTEVKIN